MSSPALYWKTQPLGALGISFTDALVASKDVMQKVGLSNIKTSSIDVSGRTPNCHAAITFLKTGNSYTTIIMAAGSEAKTILGKLSDGLNNLSWL